MAWHFRRLRLGAIAAATATPAATTAATLTATATARRASVAVGSRRFGDGFRSDLRRHLAGDAELIRLPALLRDDLDLLLESLLQVIEIVALLALELQAGIRTPEA